jgi:hypothetical protein
MKRVLFFAFAMVASVSIAADFDMSATRQESAVQHSRAQKYESSTWPAFFAFSQIPHSADVVGLRLTIPYSTSQENITGIDFGFWGRCFYMEGIQVNFLRNDVVDQAAGLQFGIYNSVGHGAVKGIQLGLKNEAFCLRGLQVGLLNIAGEAQGLQLGFINRSETLCGYQVGLINVIRTAEFPYIPFINIGF